jgi:hypothetical protein
LLFYTTRKIDISSGFSTEANAEPFAVTEKIEKLVVIHRARYGFVQIIQNLLALQETMQGFLRKLRNLQNVYRTIKSFV